MMTKKQDLAHFLEAHIILTGKTLKEIARRRHPQSEFHLNDESG
jgi:hypothetical protein